MVNLEDILYKFEDTHFEDIWGYIIREEPSDIDITDLLMKYLYDTKNLKVTDLLQWTILPGNKKFVEEAISRSDSSVDTFEDIVLEAKYISYIERHETKLINTLVVYLIKYVCIPQGIIEYQDFELEDFVSSFLEFFQYKATTKELVESFTEFLKNN